MLEKVSESCFLFSYLVVLLIESARLYLKLPGKHALVLGMLGAGIFAHSIFLYNQWMLVPSGMGLFVANWSQWIFVAAWGLAIAYFVVTLRKPNTVLGIFIIPLILGLIWLGQLLPNSESFRSVSSIGVWQVVHGVSLAVGTMFICFGASFGLMYLILARRFKSKRTKRGRLKLPSLEFLQSMNRLSLITATVALALGLISGIALNINRGQLSWFSSGILVSFALFLWSLFATILEFTSSGSLGGRRSAQLVLANFVFMVLVLSVVLLTSHGQGSPSEEPTGKENRESQVEQLGGELGADAHSSTGYPSEATTESKGDSP
ncbi:MAG: cytochrome C assembly protein [Pirellulaceae bacterium]